LGLCQIYNIEERRLVTDSTGWAGNIGLAIAASKFTKSVFSATAGSHLQFKTKKDLFLLVANYNIISANGERFDDRTQAHFRYNRKVNKWLRMEYFFQIQTNALTKIRQRFLNGIGPRFKLSPHEKAKFYLGMAYMYEFESLLDPALIERNHRMSSYLTYTLVPSDNATFSNTTYFQPLIQDFFDYRIANDSKLNFTITRNLRFTAIISFRFDAHPPEEIPGLSYQINNGLTYKF